MVHLWAHLNAIEVASTIVSWRPPTALITACPTQNIREKSFA
jgi:hypothetical protein